MTRLRLLLLLLFLTLGPHLARPEEEETYDDASDEDVSQIEDAKEEEEKKEEKNEEENELVASLTKDICKDALNRDPETPIEGLCCKPHFDVGPEGRECMEAYAKSNKKEEMARHDLANCVFIKKKYTKGNEDLNFKRIKADIDRIPDPNERKTLTKIIRGCNAKAKLTLLELKKQNRKSEPMNSLRRPFFYLVFSCIASYTEQAACPYFMWQKDVCGKYIDKCRTLLKGEKM